MKLSIIIVNFNVKYFIEQCLYSVFKAIKTIDSEIWVVDNNSVDGSCSMIKSKFPSVKLIENKENVGFSKANNQAIRLSEGEYILLLNPDTIVEEDTFAKIINFMEQNPNAGGLGVKMIDGKGRFLPESKRALPTPEVSFYKIFGLSKLFPKSRRFAQYHLGYLSNDEVHEIEILSGAFMFMRKTVLDKIGLLDENFFMYGEDIDLSYRIIKAGYKNYYFPETKIIHYKGESTKKGSINYVFVFYNAMIIFAKKHFSAKNAKIYSFLINFAIYFRALLAVCKRVLSKVLLPFAEAATIFAGYYFVIPYWELMKYNGVKYPDFYIFVVVPLYILIWLTSIFYSGGYEKKIKFFNIIKGLFLGTLFILTIYGLLNENYRFSRALIFIGTAWTAITVFAFRYFLHFLSISPYKLESKRKKKIIIVGKHAEAMRVENILNQVEINFELSGIVNIVEQKDFSYIGNFEQLKEIVTINKIDEIIFCSNDISSSEIIDKMLELSDIKIDYKIAPPESVSIIGSNSINAAGDLYTVDFNSIVKENNKRIKRLFDFWSAAFLLCLYPLIVWFVNEKLNFGLNIIKVIWGNYSWVGYAKQSNVTKNSLPKIKKGILNYLDISKKIFTENAQKIEKYNLIYAKDYSIMIDIKIFFKNIKHLGRKNEKS